MKQTKTPPPTKKPAAVNKKFVAQIELFKDYHKNPTKAKFDKLFNDNLGIVNFCVNRWFKHPALNHKRDDMIQEGSIGLMSAIRKFNPDLGKKFSPYAVWWVRQAIMKHILTDKNVKLPIPLMSAIKKYNEDPDGFETDQFDPEKAKTKGFKEMMQRYKVQRFDLSLDEELGNSHKNDEHSQSLKDMLVTNINNSYSGSVYDGVASPFLAAGDNSFANYEFDNENSAEYAEYVDALTRLSRKDVVVVALRYGFSEGEAVVFADMLQAMEQLAAQDSESLSSFTGLRHFAPVEKRNGSAAKPKNSKRKYITRKEETAADFRTISGIVKDMGFAKVNHATARNIVNSRLYDIAEFLNVKRNIAEPTESKKLSEEQIKSIILTSPAFHERFAEVLKGSYAYLLRKKKEQETSNEI